MKTEGMLALEDPEGDGLRFQASFAARTLILDDTKGTADASPVQAMLAALVACSAMDVVSILRKKRQVLTRYEISMSGERADEHPRRFLSIDCVHRISGRGLKRRAAEEALQLSLEKYCSVSHCLRPDLPVRHVIEIVETGG